MLGRIGKSHKMEDLVLNIILFLIHYFGSLLSFYKIKWVMPVDISAFIYVSDSKFLKQR